MNSAKYCDFHLHSSLSSDSNTPMAEMIQAGIARGLLAMCFTEHLDLDFPTQYGLDFLVDMNAYQNIYQECLNTYGSQIKLGFGIELGILPHLSERLSNFLSQYPFDFVIGSSHIIDGTDPFYPEFWEGRTEKEAVTAYFEATLDNLLSFSDIDVYGHIDYVIRYAPTQNLSYSPSDYSDILDEILKTLIDKNIGIELNTGGYKYGLGHPNPCEEILKRYRQLGGEILTLGSDAHAPEHVGYAFDKAVRVLRECGFRYYAIFRNRKPEFLPLS